MDKIFAHENGYNSAMLINVRYAINYSYIWLSYCIEFNLLILMCTPSKVWKFDRRSSPKVHFHCERKQSDLYNTRCYQEWKA